MRATHALPARTLRVLAAAAALLIALPSPAQSAQSARSAQSAAAADRLELSEFTLDRETERELTRLWIEQLRQRKATKGWVPMRADLTDEMLDLLGLPPRAVLSTMRFPEPTIVDRSGRTETIALSADDPAVAAVAGAGWFGIRPGAWLLINGEILGWCSMAHVYGSPGRYDISTAGHCAPRGATATIVAAFGSRDGVAGPVLLDFGTFAQSVNNGPGRDWALIDIHRRHQHLVTPTMAFWGGPRGMYTKTGAVATIRPQRSVTPDPLLAQSVVQYGHGTGVGTGGTPRAGAVIHWGTSHFIVSGAFSFGDSGSGINTVTGDTVGATMEAGGIFTHMSLSWLDLMPNGIGTMAGTRATQVPGRLANGQLVPYPLPLPGRP